MTRVVVAVPAHDEADEVADCLAALEAAAARALAEGGCEEVVLGVSAHRCTDDTRDVAEGLLASREGRFVIVDETSRTVGGVRDRLIRTMTSDVPDPRSTWVFNTDADSRVPDDWITATLAAAGEHVVAVAGMVALRGWTASRYVQDDYRRLLADGIAGTTHSHVYGANLAVRLDAYERVGGFRSVHAEDQDLVDRLRAVGETVGTGLTPVVLTSAREPGRANGGLGDLLRSLRAARDGSVPAPRPTTAYRDAVEIEQAILSGPPAALRAEHAENTPR